MNALPFRDRTDVRYLAVVFIGKKKYWMEEVGDYRLQGNVKN